jgi:hypothetical protein
VPAKVKIFGYQDDLVNVVSATSHLFEPYLGETIVVPYFQVRKMVLDIGGPHRVEFIRNGETNVIYRERGEIPDNLEATSWLLTKYLRFRAVDTAGPQQCRH